MTCIRPATQDDVQGISQLLAKYYIGRLSDAQKARGFISVEFAATEIENMVRSPGTVVAVTKAGTMRCWPSIFLLNFAHCR